MVLEDVDLLMRDSTLGKKLALARHKTEDEEHHPQQKSK